MINNLSSLTDDSCQTNDLIVEEEENDEYYLNQLQRFSVWIQDQGENVISPDAKYARTRRLIARFLNTMAVHVTIIVLASLDAVILIAVQLLTIEALKALVDTSSPKYLKTKLEDAQFGLECVSISIISLFMIEITVKFFVFGPKHFCAHWMDVLDAVVTLISLALDAFLIADHLLHITKGVEAFEAAAALIIVFRLWRIVRIVNATLVGIHNAMHKKLQRMKQTEARLQCRVYQLERRLIKYNVPLPKDLETEHGTTTAPKQLHHRVVHSRMKQMRNNSSKTLFKVGSDQTFDGLGSTHGTSTDLTDTA